MALAMPVLIAVTLLGRLVPASALAEPVPPRRTCLPIQKRPLLEVTPLIDYEYDNEVKGLRTATTEPVRLDPW